MCLGKNDQLLVKVRMITIARGFRNYPVPYHTHEETEPKDNVRQVVRVGEERTGQTSRRAVRGSLW